MGLEKMNQGFSAESQQPVPDAALKSRTWRDRPAPSAAWVTLATKRNRAAAAASSLDWERAGCLPELSSQVRSRTVLWSVPFPGDKAQRRGAERC